MKNKRFYFKILIGVLVFCAAMTTWGCKYVHTAYDKRDKTRAYVVYEAIFVDNEQVKDIFAEIRGEAPYPIVTQDFHVTTAFLPETDARFLYGKKIQVHIVGYKAGRASS